MASCYTAQLDKTISQGKAARLLWPSVIFLEITEVSAAVLAVSLCREF